MLVLAGDPAEMMGDLLEELTVRQDKPLASVDLRAACEVTALRSFCLQPLYESAE